MFITALASLVLAQGATTFCPISGSASPADGPAFDYNGARYTICCAGCATPFKQDPAKALKNEKLKDKLVAIALFDPISGSRIEVKDAKGGFSDYAGTRYYFASADSKNSFDGEPKKFAVTPEKEALYCPVMGHEVKDYASAGGFVDFEKTRYYVCCGGCAAEMKKDAGKYAAKAKNVKAPTVVEAPKKKGS